MYKEDFIGKKNTFIWFYVLKINLVIFDSQQRCHWAPKEKNMNKYLNSLVKLFIFLSLRVEKKCWIRQMKMQ